MKMLNLQTLERTLNNEASPEEAREVVRWLKTPEGQAWLAERMNMDEKLINLGEEERWTDHPIPSVLMYQNIMHRLHRQRIRRVIIYAASILIPVALFIGLFAHVNSRVNLLAVDEYSEVYVPNGERMQVLFQDGSKVYLNSGSHLRYPKKFGLSERKIYLEGEAWFEIAENKARPFIVELSHIDIKVLGTTFDVKAYPEENTILVTLETGSIELKSHFLKPYQLRPGNKAIYNKSTKSCQVIHTDNVGIYSAWRRNVLVFKGESLSDVLRILSRTYNVHFDVKDSIALRYTYTITTGSTSLATVLKELEKITPVVFKEKDGKIEVRMKK